MIDHLLTSIKFPTPQIKDVAVMKAVRVRKVMLGLFFLVCYSVILILFFFFKKSYSLMVSETTLGTISQKYSIFHSIRI